MVSLCADIFRLIGERAALRNGDYAAPPCYANGFPIPICRLPQGAPMLKSILSLVFLCIVGPAEATEAGWALLRDGGQAILMRHAYAPGATASRDVPDSDTGDSIGEGSLSDRGRQQARRIGALFAARAAP